MRRLLAVFLALVLGCVAYEVVNHHDHKVTVTDDGTVPPPSWP